MIRKRTAAYFACCLIAGLISCLVSRAVRPVLIDHFMYGLHFPASVQTDPRIVIVEIDAESAAYFGDAMRDRRFFADAVLALENLGAGTIALDVLFEEKSSPDGDEALASAAFRAGNVILAARTENSGPGRIIPPYDQLAAAAKGVGPAGISFTIRGRVDFIAPDRNKAPLHFVRRIYWDYAGIKDKRQTGLHIFYTGDERAFIRISIRDLLEGKGRREQFEGALAIVGVTTAPMADHFYTPLSTRPEADTAGVVIWANALYTLLNGKNISLNPWLDAACTMGASLLLGLLIFKSGPVKSAFISALALLSIAALHQAQFPCTLHHVNLTPAIMSGAAVWAVRLAFLTKKTT